MWQAPTWWDSWRLLKDGRHQVSTLATPSSLVLILRRCYPHFSLLILTLYLLLLPHFSRRI